MFLNQIVTAKAIDRDFMKNRPLVITLFVLAYNPRVSGPTSNARLTISVTDLNDNAPKFTKPSYMFNVSESAKIGMKIATVTAMDVDFGTNALVVYSIVSGNSPPTFKIDSSTGALSLTNTLDHETRTRYSLTVQARDSGNPPLFSTTTVTIVVENANDNFCLFTLTNYFSSIRENLPAGQNVVTVFATDSDNHQCFYQVTDPLFDVNSTTGLVQTTAPLDREKGSPYSFLITALDFVNVTTTATATITVDIIDVNDNAPAFTQQTYSFTTPENVDIGVKVGEVTASDPDYLSNGDVTYSIVTSQSTFYIQPTTGIIETVASLDYFKQKSYVFVVRAMDGGNPAMTSTSTVNIAVTDVNTYAPQFTQRSYTASIKENIGVGTTVATVSATDKDPGTGLVYTMVHGSNGKFAVNSNNGQVTITAALDFETQRSYELVIRCSDGFNPALTNITFVYVILIDVNDNPPQFSPIPSETPKTRDVVSVSRLAPVGTTVYNPLVSDADSTGQYSFSLQKAAAIPLNVSSPSGSIVLGGQLGESLGNGFSVTLMVSDGVASSSLLLVFSITTPDSQKPNFALAQYQTSISENSMQGSTVTRVQAYMVESDSSGSIRYSLSGSALFSINTLTGVVVTAQTLDADVANPTITATVTATISSADGQQSWSSNAQVSVYIYDFNDNAPTFTSCPKTNISQADPAGTAVATVAATDADKGFNAAIRFSIMSGGEGVFNIDPSLGIIYSTQQLNPAVQSLYNVTVGATNPVQFPLTSFCTVSVKVLNINDRKPSFVQPSYHFHLSEAATVGSVVGSVGATDPDTGSFGQLTYSLVPNPASATFRMNSKTGQITTALPLDRETTLRYMFQVQATDGGGQSTRASVYVFIDDVNDNSPVFNPATYSVAIGQKAPVSTGIVALRCTDKDYGTNGTAGLKFAIISGDSHNRFQVSSNGLVTIANPLDKVLETTFLLTVQATDGGPIPRSSTATVNVTTYPATSTVPRFDYASYTVNLNDPVAASALITTVSAKGNGTITYSIKTSNVPFSVDRQTGKITSNRILNAENQANWIFTVQAMDKYGQVGFAAVHLNLIHQNEHAPVFNPTTYSASILESAAIGASVTKVFATDVDAGSDGAITYSTASDNFGVDPTTGVVTTKITLDRESRSTYTFIIIASDGGTPQLTATATVSVTVSERYYSDSATSVLG